ncbi:MAG: hypothetical protein Q7I94_03715, partial [Candidatus Contubernalis sp.]|nr:hypothetical protein [Candidatus Contubernalis sp.]
LINYDLDKQHVKSNLKILLCGSYNPSKELTRMIEIKDILIKKGWKKTHLARDYPVPVPKNRRPLIHCQEAISDAGVIIFIFTKQGGGSDGRGMELSYILGTSYLIFKSYFIIEQDENGTSYASELIQGELDNNENKDIRFNTSYVPVDDIEHLIDTIESQLVNHLEGSIRVVPPDSTL